MDLEYCAHGDRRVNPGKKVRGIPLTGIYPTIGCGALEESGWVVNEL